jgi:hypothetical protein
MTIKTNYFDGTGYSYSSADLIAPWASLMNDGVFNVSSGALSVLAHSPAGLSVDVQIGNCIKNGYFVKSDSIVNLPITANTSGYNRIDLIVVNVDTTNKATTFQVVQGTASSSPTAPIPASNQLPLAQVYVGNNVSVINQANITDLRTSPDTFTAQKNSFYRQAIINGNFDIWQRGSSKTYNSNTSTPTYGTADRWNTNINNGNSGILPNCTISQQANDGSLNGSRNFLRMSADGVGSGMTNPFWFLSQKIENGTKLLGGKQVTVSFLARSSVAGQLLGITLQQQYGTGGSPSATEFISGTTVALTTTWQKYCITFTLNTVVNKTFGTNGDDCIELDFCNVFGSTVNSRFNTSSTQMFMASNLDIAQVQFNIGNVALPFMPKTFDDELKACLRYFEKSYYYTSAPFTGYGADAKGVEQILCSVANTFYNTVKFKAVKRTIPTNTIISYHNGTIGSVTNAANNADCSVYLANQGDAGFMVYKVGDSSFTVGNTYAYHWTADAEL